MQVFTAKNKEHLSISRSKKETTKFYENYVGEN